MLRKLAGVITNNFGLKILGTVFAIILWLVVVNTVDPEKSVVITASVKIENANYLTDMGKTYEVVNDSDIISFTVTGKRSVVENLTASDFTIVANMENIDETMTKIPISVTASSYGNQLEITKRSSYVTINVENVVSGEYTVELVTEGELSADCYIASETLSSERVAVSGPESVVSQIVQATITVDITGASSDVTSTQEIVFLDESGNTVSTERLTLDVSTVEAVINILMRKELAVSFTVSGTPPDGYEQGEVSADVSSVVLEGPASVLGEMSSLEITSSLLDVSSATKTFKAIIALADYLPDGVSLAEGETEEAEITVEILSTDTVSVEMPVGNIEVTGLSGDLILYFDTDTITVELAGSADDYGDLDGADLYGTLDASSLVSGTYSAEVTISGDYADVASASASVTIVEASSSDDEEMSGSEDLDETEGTESTDNSEDSEEAGSDDT